MHTLGQQVHTHIYLHKCFPVFTRTSRYSLLLLLYSLGCFCLFCCCCCLFVLHSCARLYFAFPMGTRSIMASWKILVFPQRKASCEIEIFSNVIVLPSLINLYRVGGTAAQLCQDKASPPPFMQPAILECPQAHGRLIFRLIRTIRR